MWGSHVARVQMTLLGAICSDGRSDYDAEFLVNGLSVHRCESALSFSQDVGVKDILVSKPLIRFPINRFISIQMWRECPIVQQSRFLNLAMCYKVVP